MSPTKTSTGAALTLCMALGLTGCASEDPSEDNTATTSVGPQSIVIGTTDQVVTLDPAGAYDHGSFNVEIQAYQFLYTYAQGSDVLVPDAAENCDFTTPTDFTCILKSGLTFANGHALTSSDVKFSFDRVLAINDPRGPAALLSNLAGIVAVDERTVVFQLHNANDQTWLQVLATNAGPIVDEEVFSANSLTSDAMIVAANAFSGPYIVRTYKLNNTIEFVPNPNYNGAHGAVQNASVTVRTFTGSAELRTSIANGEIDVAYRSFSPADLEALRSENDVRVWHADGGEARYLVFNFESQPGETEEQKLAVRRAVASLINRQDLSDTVYRGQYVPLCSFVPLTYFGSNSAVCDIYGSQPEPAKAESFLVTAGLTIPVSLQLYYNTDHYGSSSEQEFSRIKHQLETSGLFSVELQMVDWNTYSAEYPTGAYPMYQMSWFPDFPDPDNYLNPFFNANSFLNQGFYAQEVVDLLVAEVTEANDTRRLELLNDLQVLLAERYLPIIPLLSGPQWAVTRNDVSGVHLNPANHLAYGTITKG